MMLPTALRRAREQRGWAQAHVAREVGTDARTISRWERGVTSPSPHFRTQLCELFQSDASTLGFLEANDEALQLLPYKPEFALRLPLQPLQDPFSPRFLLPHDSFIGRETLLHDVLDRLQPGGVCALHGLPGVGKTTVAQALAHHPETLRLFPDGVLWMSLGPEPDLSRAFAHWGDVLDLPEAVRTKEHSVQEWSHLLRERIGHRRLLLVIDDVWALETALPFLVGGPGCTHLVTTRFPSIALDLSGDLPIHVPELTNIQSFHLLTTLVPALLQREHDEMHLLLDRAGGLPLALLLLGKYLRSHAYSGQPRRLSQALRTLSEETVQWSLTMPFSSLRPQTLLTSTSVWSLETVIGVSEAHLPTEAQHALRALSVLPAKPHHFSEASALAVMGQGTTVLDILYDTGFVESASSGWYCMHQTIAAYGRMHLHDQTPWSNLVQHALQLSELEKEDYPLLEQEHLMLLSALEATATQGWTEHQVQLTRQLRRFWLLQGHHALARQHLTAALPLTQQLGNLREEGWMRHMLGILTDMQSHTQEAQHLFEEGLALARSLIEPDQYLEGAALNSLGVVLVKQGKLHQAQGTYEEALRLARMLERSDEMSMSLGNIGTIALSQGRVQEAKNAFLEGLALVADTNASQRAQLWIHLGSLSTFMGQDEEAFTAYHHAQEATDGPFIQCQVYLGLGTLARRSGNSEEAERWLQKGQALAHEIGVEEVRIEALASRAELAQEQGELERAEALFEEALTEAQRLGYHLETALIQTQRGMLRLTQGRIEEAANLFALAATPLHGEETALEAEIVYGRSQVAAAQGRWQEAERLGEKAIHHFAAMSHWRTPVVQRWREQVLQKENVEESAPRPAPPLGVVQDVVGDGAGVEVHAREEGICPTCARSDALTKRGKTRGGRQRYSCPHCKRSFVLRRVQETNRDHKERVHQLAKAGWSCRAIAQGVGIHHTTVSRWLNKIT